MLNESSSIYSGDLPNFPLERSALIHGYRLLALVSTVCCFFSIVNGSIQQFQMFLLGGQLLVSTVLVKALILFAVLVGCILRPSFGTAGLPAITWLLCMSYLLCEIAHLAFARGMSFGDILYSYYDYYLLLLIGPLLIVFYGAVSERVVIRCTVIALVICSIIGIAQNLTNRPIIYTQSATGAFTVESWEFIGSVRAFSLFGSAMDFGMFCALCGALGIALYKTSPIIGISIWALSAISCYTTMTRMCYLVFLCSCICSLVLTFGRKPGRGLWYPVLNCLLGISTLLYGLNSPSVSDAINLQDTGSLFMRIEQWTYYLDLIAHASLNNQLFGFGIVQNKKILPLFPMTIDSLPLALVLHIGFVGLVLIGTLMIQMWLYLRREAIATRQPFVIAAASLWATFACAGVFNMVFNVFGAVFALVILCKKRNLSILNMVAPPPSA